MTELVPRKAKTGQKPVFSYPALIFYRMGRMEHHEIVMEGARARATGLPRSSNPYLIGNFRTANGFTVREWVSRGADWNLGWDMADASPNMPSVKKVGYC